MCYVVWLSTTSEVDLSVRSSDLVRFSKDEPRLDGVAMLQYANKWYVGSSSGCSCSFRHLYIDSVDLGFGPPVEWYSEEPGHVEATRRFMAIVRELSTRTDRVDCVALWNDADPGSIRSLTVRLDEVADEAFRFFENHYFAFS